MQKRRRRPTEPGAGSSRPHQLHRGRTAADLSAGWAKYAGGVGDPDVDTVLVNRFYLRGVEQIDKRTGEKAQKLPGQPLGGINWQDRS